MTECPNCVTPWKCNGPHMTDDLPPLPEPAYEAYYYTADQMRAYGDARAAAATERAAQVCDEHASIEGIAQKCAAAIRAGS